MQGEEVHFRFQATTKKWYCYFGSPDTLIITCDNCKAQIKHGQRVYLNFDNGKMFCESHKQQALTDFVQKGVGNEG